MNETGIRLQKVLAAAGVASRRVGEDLIHAGRVEVNGDVVTEQGRRVDPERDVIRVDGARIPPARNTLYRVVNKPRGVVSAMTDPHDRRTIADLLKGPERLFHVGRLDYDTEGLLLLTNDGDFAQRMTHPSFEVPKTYIAVVNGSVDNRTLTRLRKGVELEDGWIKADKVRLRERAGSRSMVELTLHSGRNRIVRRMMEEVGHTVRDLSRTAIGPVRLGQLKSGQVRDLTREELGALLDLVGL